MSSGNLVSPGNGGSAKEYLQRVSRRLANPVMYSTSTNVGNTAGNIITLQSYTLPAISGGYYWKGNEQGLRITACGTVAANANSKTIQFDFGGNNMFSRASTMNGGSWKLVIELARIDIDEFRSWGSFQCDSALGSVSVDIQRGSWLSAGNRLGEGAILELIGGSAGAADDVACELFRVEQFQSPNAY